MIRTLNSNIINEIANHEDVRFWLAYNDEVIDLGHLVSNINNYCFLTDEQDGGYILVNHGKGHYVAHTLAKPSARGKPMYQLMQDGFRFLFTNTDCIEISTLVPDGNKKALHWANIAGFKPTFRREEFFPQNNQMIGGQFFTMTYQDWVLNCEHLSQIGEDFHEKIETAFGHFNHPYDAVHDKFVGATILGCRAGNITKAIEQYNKWALLAGYLPVQILNNTPPTIYMGTAIIQIGQENELEILAVSEE